MKGISWKQIKKGIIIIQVETINPERFINILWEQNIKVKAIKRINVVTLNMEVSLNDFLEIKSLANATKSKITILDKKGIIFFLLLLKKRKTLLLGMLSFALVIFYYSSFIWEVNIVSEKYVSPYEIRNELKLLGVKPGSYKKNLNLKLIEEKLMENNSNIMWSKVSIFGSALTVEIRERQNPPEINLDKVSCDLIAKKDGQILRAYTSAGTLLVKQGDIVRTGQLLVKGQLGNEGNTYSVHAKGEVFAKIYYEDSMDLPVKGTKTVETGRKTEKYFLVANKTKIGLKNTKINYKKYRMETIKKGIFLKEIYYEEKDVKYEEKVDSVVDKATKELYAKMIVNLDKSVKIIDKAVDYKIEGDNCKIRVLLTTEENIAVKNY